jgi:hypothetical protein
VTSDGEGHAGTAQQTQTSLPMCSAGPSLIGSGDFSKMSPPKWREAFSKQRKKVSVFWPGKASLEPLRGKAQHHAQDMGAAFFPCASSPEAPSNRRARCGRPYHQGLLELQESGIRLKSRKV